MRKTTRQLQHSKSSRVQVGTGAPSNSEGQSGDLTLRLTKSGIKLFAKFRDKWYLVGQGNLNQLGGDKQDQIFSDNLEKVTAVEKEGKIKIKADDRGGIELFPWSIRSRKFASSWGNTLKGLIFETKDKTQSFALLETGEVEFKDDSNYYPQFSIVNTGSTVGPWLNFYHNDSNPGISSIQNAGMGSINWFGNNDADEKITYVTIDGHIRDVADGAERGRLVLSVKNDQGGWSNITINGGDSGADYCRFTNFDVYMNSNKLYLDSGNDSYIHESGDVASFVIGGDTMFVLDEANDKITHAATNHVAAIANGTEFSATNSAYAGMILGYTRLQGDLTNLSTFEIENSMTVEDSTHKITFKTPPSEKVEIEATFLINVGSTDTRIDVGLSDNSTYNSVGLKFEYDNTGLLFSDDEVDDGVSTVKWVLEASELAAIGSSNTFYIGFSTHGVAKSAWLQYGHRASHGVTDHPFVIKATALPASIYDGT